MTARPILISIALPITLATALFASAADAKTVIAGADQRIDNRQYRQEQRIEQGIASGELTRPETRRLGREQAGIVRAEARAEADGSVSRREAFSLERRQDAASRHIARQKHDRQSRP